MKVAGALREYLERNHLTVDLVEGRPAVLDAQGSVICTGATVHTALRKAILLNTPPCRANQAPEIKDETP